jgi:hypothetical protein
MRRKKMEFLDLANPPVIYESSPPDPSRVRWARSRVCILLGGKDPSDQESSLLRGWMLKIGIPVLSEREYDQVLSSEPSKYEIIGLFGDFSGQSSFEVLRDERNLGKTRIAFLPSSSSYRDKIAHLRRISNAIVQCGFVPSKLKATESTTSSCPEVIYHFFESLVVPSMMNLDISDVKNIASGMGLAFGDQDDSYESIIDRLPESCSQAGSGLLHFNCREDVRLKEIYSISKAIAKKRDDRLAALLAQDANPQQKKVFRRMNLKIGIRVLDENDFESGLSDQSTRADEKKRIRMTAILFGYRNWRSFPFSAPRYFA